MRTENGRGRRGLRRLRRKRRPTATRQDSERRRADQQVQTIVHSLIVADSQHYWPVHCAATSGRITKMWHLRKTAALCPASDPRSLACAAHDAAKQCAPAILRRSDVQRIHGGRTWRERSSRNWRSWASRCRGPRRPSPIMCRFVRTGNLLFVSGQVCFDADGKLVAKGKLGAGVIDRDRAEAAARACAINLLAQVKAALGDLDKVVRVVRLGGFINSAPDFLDGPKVMNGASDLMVAAFGDKGRHARTTVGVAVAAARCRGRGRRRVRGRLTAMTRTADWLTARPVAHRGLHDVARGIIENMPGAVQRRDRGQFRHRRRHAAHRRRRGHGASRRRARPPHRRHRRAARE